MPTVTRLFFSVLLTSFSLLISRSQLVQVSSRSGLGPFETASSDSSAVSESLPSLVQTAFPDASGFVRPGDKVSLKCIASGSPLPMVTWTLDGVSLDSRKSSAEQSTLRRALWGDYVIFQKSQVVSHVNVTVESVLDGGVYSCTASNRLGSISHSGLLRVEGRARIREMANRSAVEGESVWLPCWVLGSEAVVIQWAKDGRALPFNHRHRIHKNGTLEMTSVSKIDAGRYTCSLVEAVTGDSHGPMSAGGHSEESHVIASQSLQLKVKVPPVIEEFKFDSKLQSGMRTRIYCNVAQGDQPVMLKWFKDGLPIQAASPFSVSLPGIRTRLIDEFSLALVIENLSSSSHNGNYSCLASNDAASVNHTAQLVVNEPPSWLIEPRSVRVLQGSPLTIDCSVKGFPSPQVTWKRLIKDSDAPTSASVNSEVAGQEQEDVSSASSSSTADSYVGAHKQYHLIRSGPDYQVYENGTLRISSTTASGEFLCAAANAIGPGISKVVKVSVNVPARFEGNDKQDNLTVNNGSRVQLVCTAHGDQPISIQWKRRLLFHSHRSGVDLHGEGKTSTMEETHLPIVPGSLDTRLTIQDTSSASSVTSRLTIDPSRRDDSTVFTCIASNAYGTDVKRIHLRVEEIPDPPAKVALEYKTSRSIALTWQRGFTGNSRILEYVVTVKLDPSLHRFEQSLMSSPELLSSSSKGEHLLLLNITASDNSSSETAVIRNLLPARRYLINVLARNRVGLSTPSDTVSVLTDEEAPAGPPIKIEVRALDATSAKVQWMPPRSDLQNGQVRGYYVGYKATNGTGHFVYKTVTPSALDEIPYSLVLTSLQPFTEYAVILQAFNSVGAGPRSDEIFVSTLESSPSAWPGEVKCEAISSTSIQVTWQPIHASKANGLLSGYKVRHAPVSTGKSIKGDSNSNSNSNSNNKYSPATDADAAVTQATVSNLGKFTNYSVQVAAYTRAGEGPKSPGIICSTAEDIPGAPAAVKAAWTSSDSITVSWLPPSAPNGIVKTYTVYRRSHAANESADSVKPATFTVPAHVDSFTASSLQKQSHSFWVTASTRVGEGPGSQVVSLQLDQDTGPARIVDFGGMKVRREGETVELSCRTVGKPVAEREWRKEDKLVAVEGSNEKKKNSGVSGQPGGQGGSSGPSGEERKSNESPLQILEDGALRITSLSASDSGNYSCSARNGLASDLIWYQLQVLSPDPRKGESETLPVPVLRLEEVTGKSIRVRIESSRGSVANGPAEQTSDATTMGASARPLVQKIYFKNLQAKSEWKHYVIEDTASPSPAVPSVSPLLPGSKSGVDANGSFVLSNLLCGNQYQIYVVNLNRDGHSVASEVLLAKTAGREPLAPPASVFLTRVNRTSFRLNLNTWSNGGCPILEGRVEYRNNRQKHWTLLSVNSLTDPILLANLSPDHLYKVRVSMKNSAGVTSVEYEIRLSDSKLVNAVFSKLPSSSSSMDGLDFLSGSSVDSSPELISLGTLHPSAGAETPPQATIGLLVTLTILLTLLAALAILYKSIQGKFSNGLSNSPTGMSGSTQVDQISFPSGTLGSHKHVQITGQTHQPFMANNVILSSDRPSHLHHLNYVTSPSSAELAVLRAAAASSGLSDLDMSRSLTYNARNHNSLGENRVNLRASGFGSKNMKNSSSDSAFNALLNTSSSNPTTPGTDLAEAQASAIYQYLTVARVARKNNNNNNNNSSLNHNNNASDGSSQHNALNNALLASSISGSGHSSNTGDQQYSLVHKTRDKSINKAPQATQVTTGSPDSAPRYCTPNLVVVAGSDALASDPSSLALLIKADHEKGSDEASASVTAAAAVDTSNSSCPHCLYYEEEEPELLMNESNGGDWISKHNQHGHMNHSGHSFHATASHLTHSQPQQQQSVSQTPDDTKQMFI